VSRELFLYSRTRCRPCEEMKEQLYELLQGSDCECHVLVVDGDPELEQRYGTRVPVLVAGNRELCQFRMDTAAVLSFLDTPGVGGP